MIAFLGLLHRGEHHFHNSEYMTVMLLMIGECMIGECMIGECMTGECMIGECMIGECMIGECIIGECMIGERMIGECMIVVVVANVRGPARARGGVPPGTPGEAGAEPGGGRRKAEKR